MRDDVQGQERRRRWHDEEKLTVILEVGVDGATVMSVAQRHELIRQHFYTWRPELRLKAMLLPSRGTVFIGVETASLETVRQAQGARVLTYSTSTQQVIVQGITDQRFHSVNKTKPRINGVPQS